MEGTRDESGASRGIFLGQAIGQMGANTITHGLGIVGGLALARILGPSLFGLIHGFKILFPLSEILTFGSGASLVLLPGRVAERGREAGLRFAATGFWLSVLPQVLFAALLVGYALSQTGDRGILFYGYLATAVSIVLLSLHKQLDGILLSFEEIRLRSQLQVFRAMIHFACLIPGAVFFGAIAFWIADWVGALMLVPMLLHVGPTKLLQFDRSEVGPIYRMGFPIFLSQQLSVLLVQADRLLILALLGRIELAHYAIGNSATMGMLVIVQGVMGIWGVRSLRLLSSGEDELVRTQTGELGRLMGWLSPALAVVGVAALSLLVHFFLPRYGAGVPTAMALSGIIWSVAVGTSLGGLFFHHQWQTRLVPLTLVTLILNLSLNLAAIHRGWGILGVAAMTSLSRMFVNLLQLYLGWRLLGDGPLQALRRVAVIHLPVLVSSLAFPVCLGAMVALGLRTQAAVLCGATLLFLLCLSPAFFALWRDLDLSTRFRALIERKRSKKAQSV